MNRKSKRELERELDALDTPDRDAEAWVRAYLSRMPSSVEIEWIEEDAVDEPPAVGDGEVVLTGSEGIGWCWRTAPVEDVPAWIDTEEDLPV